MTLQKEEEEGEEGGGGGRGGEEKETRQTKAIDAFIFPACTPELCLLQSYPYSSSSSVCIIFKRSEGLERNQMESPPRTHAHAQWTPAHTYIQTHRTHVRVNTCAHFVIL